MSKVQITAFTGEYYFLSNYCTCPITIDGLTYRSAEAAFQAAKCSDPIDRAAFCTVPPNVAKAIGRKIKLRDGWEKERDGIMADIIHAKFSQNPGFAQALIDTDDAELIEGNTWNDNYWGMCGCTRCRSEGTKGLNKLGKIAADRGFKLCFHHHMGTVVQTSEETDRMMANTDPRYVFLCYDTGHFTFSKEDAVKAAKEFGPRIGHVHLKDIRPDMMEKAYAEGFKFRKAVLEGCFTIPGDGCVDYPGVFKALHDAHYEGWFIVEAEQDPAKANPFEYAVMAREYIRRTAGL